MTYSRAVTGLSFAVIMFITALVPIGLEGPTHVDAEHNEPATSHLTPDGYIVSNVILGDAIPICTDTFPLSAAAAAKRWNKFFDGQTVFLLKNGDDAFELMHALCKAKRIDSTRGISSVHVIQDAKNCMSTACIRRNLADADKVWGTITGRPIIRIGEYMEKNATTGVTTSMMLGDDEDRVTRSITHELGHVFGLEDYNSVFCGTPMGIVPNYYDYTTEPTIMSPGEAADGTKGMCWSEIPTDKDEEDFQLSYVPARPIPVIPTDGSDAPRPKVAVVSWNVSHVHVEWRFEVERKRADGTWETVAARSARPLAADGTTDRPSSATISNQTPGRQSYRVVSTSKAPFQVRSQSASAEIPIRVLAPPPPSLGYCPGPDPRSRSAPDAGPDDTSCVWLPPTDLTVIDVSDTGATLRWGAVDGAAGYKVRRDGIANTTKAIGVRNSYSFPGLTARTAHVLEVATTVSSGDSHFASLTLLLPPRNLASTATTSTITLTWSSVNRAKSYDVKRVASDSECVGDSVDDNVTALTHTFTGGLTSSTDRTLCVRARNAQGPSAWASTTARTSSPPPPEPIDPTTCDADTRPGNIAVITATTTRQETQWRAAQLPVIGCIEYEEQRTVTTYTLFTVTYTCVDGGWFGTMTWHTSTIEGPWAATGNSRSCNLASSATAGRYSLPAGDHELRWDGRRIAFTVPAGATVELRWRQQDDGAYVAVLSIKQGVELVVGADALGGDDQAGATRFASTTDPTLSAIAASLRDPATEAPQQSATTPTECPVAEPSDDGVTNVDLDAAPCAIVRGGGAVTVALDGESPAITLAAERDWGTMNLTGADGTAAVMFFDFLTGGSITLALSDGSELARHIPEGNTELTALCDAMIPAAPAGDGS